LVVAQLSAAQKRQRIEDPWLMLLRLLLVGGLALLAASPFVSCTRLTLTRTGGASLAAVFIIDDSASMQASVDGASRLEQAQKAAARLVADAQPGDSFSLVLAGSPARVLLPSTTDLNGVREALAGIRPSDRGTDIKGALTLARARARCCGGGPTVTYPVV
jgi:Mg-chelatase subunit ChlD